MEKFTFDYDTIIYYNAADQGAYLMTNDDSIKIKLRDCDAVRISGDPKRKKAGIGVYKLPPGSVALVSKAGVLLNIDGMERDENVSKKKRP